MNGEQACPENEACEAVDVALDVALEAAEDQDVRRFIRRAQHARVAVRDREDHD